MEDDVKQVIVMRKDLKMRRGKEIAQGAHASVAFLAGQIRLISDPELVVFKWLDTGQTKICVQVDSEEELLEIHAKASNLGIVSYLITDAGHTEFAGVPTKTCLALGPDYSIKLDTITKELKLY